MARKAKVKSNDKQKVKYKLLERKQHALLYTLCDQLITDHHAQRLDGHPKIALAVALNWKANTDGQVKLGQCKKVAELDRDLHGNDFVIILHEQLVNGDTELSHEQRVAVLDHELCHCAVRRDKASQAIRKDERGRIVYRIRKHDIEEFDAVVQRHGMYKSDVHRFVKAAREAKAMPLLASAAPKAQVGA